MINEYKDYLSFEKRYSEHTIKAYVKDVQSFLNFVSESFDIPLLEINRMHIKAWIMHLAQDVSNKAINRKISALRGYFTFLMLKDLVSNNPCQHIKALRQKKRLPQVFQEHELEGFKDVCFGNIDTFEESRDYALLELLYQTGMRRGELIELSVNDVDVKEMTVKVLGKGGKERLIPISKGLLNIILQYLVYRDKMQLETPFLFVTKKGNKLYPKAVYNIVKKYLSLLSTMKNKSPHTLRHSFATHMLEHGADLNAVKDILGHANLSATQIYTHNTISKLREAYNEAHPKGES